MSTKLQTTRQQTTLEIGGMTCGSCARTVERALARLAGVAQAQVDAASGRARVSENVSPDALIAAVEAAGYTAKAGTEETNEGGVHERRGSGCRR